MATERAIQTTNPQTVEVTQGRRRPTSWTYRPNVDIFETADELLVVADVPGADPDGIDVSLEGGVLTIQATVPPRHHEDAQSVALEYGVGGFHRRFEIDESIDTEAVTAECRDGSLTLRLPKAPQARKRRIPVTS